MEYKEHDSIAKVVMSVLARHREMIPERELRVTVYGDILLRPGPPLDPTTGLLGELIGCRLVLLEFYSSRPRLAELLGVKAKGALAWAGELYKKSPLATWENRRIVVIGNGIPRSALRRAWEPHVWKQLETGVWYVEDTIDAYYLDLLRLPLTSETAWLHVAGDSIWANDALNLLRAQADPATRRMLAHIAKELPHMQINERHPQAGSIRRFLKAWEEVEVRNEGRNEGLHAMLSLILTQRFGEAAAAVLPQLESITDPTQLETLARRGLTITSIDALLEE